MENGQLRKVCRLGGVVCALILMGGIGCQPTLRVEQADAGERVDIDTLVHEHLQRQPMVSVAEAYRAMLLLADGEDRFNSFEEREADLVRRGVVRPAWSLKREQAIDRGSVAYMVCRILKIRGGVNLQVLGSVGVGDRRYANRELVAMELLADGPEYRFIRGSELTDLVARADRYMAEHGLYPEEPVDLKTEVGSAR